MKRIALKVDVDTFRGTVHGVPALLDLFRKHEVKATFLFSVGPDNTGRAIRRVFRKGFLRKVGRTSVVSHYGIRTLLNGTVLPGPHIGKKAGHIIRQTAAEGHEIGIHCYDHVLWQDFVAVKDYDWTRREMLKSWEAFVAAAGRAPATIGAAGWQINRYVLGLEEELGFRYASDVRGRSPFRPELGGISSGCVQLPTTLPTLDEIIGMDGVRADNCWRAILDRSNETLEHGHVFTLHAELEGMKLMPAMRSLLDRWRWQGFIMSTLGQLYESLDKPSIPRLPISFQKVDGRSGQLACQKH